MIPLALLCGALLALLYAQARRYDKQIKLLMDRAELERSGLLNRIQAPELAVLPENNGEVAYVAPDDDAAYWAAVEDRDAA